MLFQACAYCAHPNPLGTNFCNDCGAALHLQPCRKCGAVSVATASSCRSCKQPFPERPVIDVAIPWAGAAGADPRMKEGRSSLTAPPPISSIAQSSSATAAGRARAPLVPPFPGDDGDASRDGFDDAPDPLSSPRAGAGTGTSPVDAGHPAHQGTSGTAPGDPATREARAVSDEAAAATRRLIEKASQAQLLRQRDQATHRGELVLPVPLQRRRMAPATADPFDVTSPLSPELPVEPMRADPLDSSGTASGGALVAFPTRPPRRRSNGLNAPRVVALVLIVALVAAGWLLFDRFQLFEQGGLRLPSFGGEVGPASQARQDEPRDTSAGPSPATPAAGRGGVESDAGPAQARAPMGTPTAAATENSPAAGAAAAATAATTRTVPAGSSSTAAKAASVGVPPAAIPGPGSAAAPTAPAVATTGADSAAVSPAAAAGTTPAAVPAMIPAATAMTPPAATSMINPTTSRPMTPPLVPVENPQAASKPVPPGTSPSALPSLPTAPAGWAPPAPSATGSSSLPPEPFQADAPSSAQAVPATSGLATTRAATAPQPSDATACHPSLQALNLCDKMR
jgi:hypothetical protein